MARLKAPTIPGAKHGEWDGQWIDLLELGSANLLTYIKYDSIAVGDVLWPNWRGCSAEGEAQDHAQARVDVTEEDGYTPELGMPVEIPNERLISLDQGWIFYSYAVADGEDPNDRGPESARIFCYVGERRTATQQLPVPQIRESHDLRLAIDAITSAGATGVVPPYQAMSVGDEVTFTWQGYYQGLPEPPWISPKRSIETADIGHPLVFMIPEADVLFSDSAEISYKVEYVGDLGQDSVSEPQMIEVIEHDDAMLLPAIKIKGHDGGPLNPADFLDGLTLQVEPVYPGIQIGDGVLLYWGEGNQPPGVIKYAKADRSTIDSGVLELHLEHKWLMPYVGKVITASFQYARGGAGQSGQPLALTVKRPLHLPMPHVVDAKAEQTGNAWWLANTSGAYVEIPDDAQIDGAQVEVHWYGHQVNGRHIAPSPVAGYERRYFIPSTAIAANMSSDDSKRFPVFYRVTLPDESPEDSARLNLRIEPLDSDRYPAVQCRQGTSTVRLRDVTNGADLYLESSQPAIPVWPFMAKDQLLTISATGVAHGSGEAVATTVRNAMKVTSDEFILKKIEEILNYSFLNGLKRDQQFSLISKVSFDGGETYQSFKSTYLTLTN
ncbi:hypothetical protein [Pseudomonas sp. QTF5]|uniref:hypothetical protein n=1 Tax=Pseudomonas sp. QTF5 TaxID=1435425 RepID=UPI0004B91505|nr:hypothetical protein [Pseudomonas sp. QTF5]